MNLSNNEPFILRPVGKDYLWGGQRLNKDFNKNIDMDPLAESWECSTHPDGTCSVKGGSFDGMLLSEVLKKHPEYLGEHVEKIVGAFESSKDGGYDGQIPILLKLIDAKQDLSVQVHPSDDYAFFNEKGQLGKSEMWYVLDAEPGARLVYGLRTDCTPDMIRDAAARGKMEKYLQFVPIEKGDVFFIEAGTIHAIGSGALIAEIQESSNLTYRFYDYDRVDKYGNKRELHIEKALTVANLNASPEPHQGLRVLRYAPGVASELLSRCRYFEVHRMLVNTSRGQKVTYSTDELSFRVLMCIEGDGEIIWDNGNLKVRKGDCIFIPANSPLLTLKGRIQMLDVRC
ncbi:MAG: class I mannose-6-phosphate isomerase [Butyrivibrio sp.]|nr:class I mannose-6-phosphate isomerase [Butyrivibrio sp.]